MPVCSATPGVVGMSEQVTDLIDTDEAITTTIDFSPPAREPGVRRNADGYEIGVCRVCGNDSATPSGTYCADHKTRQTKPSVGEDGAVPPGNATVSRPTARRAGRGAPTGDEWSTKVFDKVVILMSALLAASMVRRYGLNDPNDDIADSLTMEGDEARRIARPLGRFMAGTSFSKKQGRRVLENSDLLDAGFALYDYFDRVNRTLRLHTAGVPLASVTNIREEGETSGPIEQETAQFGGPGDFPDFSVPYVP